jgi:hypothetical protein
VIIYTAGAIAGFTLSSCAAVYIPALPFLHGSYYTVGAPASISGLIGALLYYGRSTGSGIVRAEAMRIVLMLAVVRIHHARHRQLRASRRLRRRIPGVNGAQSDETGTRRSHPDRARLPRRIARVDHRRPS